MTFDKKKWLATAMEAAFVLSADENEDMLLVNDALALLERAYAEGERIGIDETLDAILNDFEGEVLKRRRGIRSDAACESCAGFGIKTYANGATWRGGQGVASYTKDVCEKCWGSGDKNKAWLDLRALAAARKGTP